MENKLSPLAEEVSSLELAESPCVPDQLFVTSLQDKTWCESLELQCRGQTVRPSELRWVFITGGVSGHKDSSVLSTMYQQCKYFHVFPSE